MMGDPILFSVSQIHWPHIYQGRTFIEDEQPRFGAAVLASEAPDALKEHLGAARRNESLGVELYSLSGLHKPAVISDLSIHTILTCTDDANLPRDRLFTDLGMDLAVMLYEIPAGRRGPARKLAAIRAVRVRHGDLLRRYDEVCAEFFADPTLPYRGPPIRS